MPSDRTRVRRVPSRGRYDADAVVAILDEAFLCHVSYVENQSPTAVPMLYGRDGDQLLLHGSSASRTIRALARGTEVCVTVTLLDGVVFARSAFHHSANYRSVVIYGIPSLIRGNERKVAALKVISDHIAPGRWEESRTPDEKEMRATSVIQVPLEEVSAKIREGGPEDDERDASFETWTGHVPLAVTPNSPISHPENRMPVSRPIGDFISRWSKDGI